MKISPANMGNMGYDRAITVFNPEGRLLQVEYAQKAVSSGAIAMGLVCQDSVILIADRPKVEGLLALDHTQKIFELDKHIGCAAAGLIADARIIVKNARDYAQKHRMSYGEGSDIKGIVTQISNLKQAYTQYGGIRPFGTSILIGGYDDKGPALYVTDPAGVYFKYYARAVGINSGEANALLEKQYKPSMSTEDGLKLAKKIVKKVLGKDYSAKRIECSVVLKNKVARKSIIN